ERAIEVLSTLKLSEFQAYFNDPCIEIAIEKNPNLQLENDSATRIYTFVTPDRTYLIVNNPGRSIKLHTIDISEIELNRIAFEYLEEIYEPYRWNYKDKARPLYDLLIAPIMSDLAGVEQITFIQDGILRNMPMESLFDGERYLIQDYTIDYASGLAGRPQVLRKRERSFIAGSTIFPNTGFTELPFVEAELKFLKQKLPNHTLLENEEFTIAEVERLLASSRYDRLHFATHGFFGGNADNSFILAYDGKIDILKFNSLFASLDVPPSLLFLSGCETAKGNSQAPLGITGTAIRGGTSNVIATMWAIQDSIAVEFVKDFYTFLDEGKSIAEAKRAAQLNLVELHPTIWASFMAFKI
ncbi:MAG: CHAT domain-containing protein, partial [Prochloraceae cyanobacterium]